MSRPKSSLTRAGRRGRGKPPAPDWLIGNISELSRSARTLYIVFISFLIYCILTTLTTPDRKLILNKEVHLPIINLDVSLLVFVLTAPLVAIFVYLYFQFYLQALRATIRRLYSDYARPDEGRIYPWMINLVEEPEPGLLGILRGLIIKISLWLMLPVTLILFTFFVLRKHDIALALYEWASSVVSTLLILWLWKRYEREGGEAEQPPVSAKAGAPVNGRLSNAFGRWATTFVARWQRITSGTLLLGFQAFMLLMIAQKGSGEASWFNVDLSNEQLAEEKKYGDYWVDLHAIHLEEARIYNAFLRQADLRGAYLQSANLQHADMTGANLSDARLNNAELSEADLSGANLSGADLSGSNLNCAKLPKAHLQSTTLKGAYLISADLTELQGEDLSGLFVGVKSLFHATSLPPEVAARLREARPDLFANVEWSGAIVNRLAPDSNTNAVVFMNNEGQRGILREDSLSRFNRRNTVSVAMFRDQDQSTNPNLGQSPPKLQLLASPEDAKLIQDNLVELQDMLVTEQSLMPKNVAKLLEVQYVSGITPVFVRANNNTYFLEEMFVLVNDPDYILRQGSPVTLWVFVRSKEVLVPCIR